MQRRKFNYTFLTSREVAITLDISPDSVNLLARMHKLPGIKVGRRWRFKKRDITVFKRQMEKNLRAA